MTPDVTRSGRRKGERAGVAAAQVGGGVCERIARFNVNREPERLALKYLAMRSNPFAFFRGTAHLFWEDWPAGRTPLDDAPRAWSCGDLHLENFGSYRGDNGLAYFDVNDFDEGALAPATRDPARFLTSVHIAAATLGISASDATGLCKGFVSAYADALADGKARWVERATAIGMVKDLLRGVKRRTREELLAARTRLVGKHRRLRLDGRHALSLSRGDRAHVLACLNEFGKSREKPRFYEVLDVARRVAGTGSLGVQRFVLLVRGKGDPLGNVLLDLKEVLPSALAAHSTVPQPPWESESDRVVQVQRRMQSIAPALLQGVTLGVRSFVLRELQPIEDRLALAHTHGKVKRLQRVMSTMGHIVAWAQLRSGARQGSAGTDDFIGFARSTTWRDELLRYAREYSAQVHRDWNQFVRAHVDPAGTLEHE